MQGLVLVIVGGNKCMLGKIYFYDFLKIAQLSNSKLINIFYYYFECLLKEEFVTHKHT